MDNYFTKEYSKNIVDWIYFEKDNKLCKHIADYVRIYSFNTAHIGKVSVKPFSKDVILETYIYSPIHDKVDSVIFKLKSVGGEYRIDENIGGW